MKPENAALAAGFSKSYARAKAYRIEQSANVGMRDAFERAGLTDKAIVEHALEGLKADKVISCNIIAPHGEGMKDANSMTKDFVDVPDWASRHKYFNTVCEMTDRIRHKVEHSGSIKGGQKVVIIVQEKDGDKSQGRRLPTSVFVEPA